MYPPELAAEMAAVFPTADAAGSPTDAPRTETRLVWLRGHDLRIVDNRALLAAAAPVEWAHATDPADLDGSTRGAGSPADPASEPGRETARGESPTSTADKSDGDSDNSKQSPFPPRVVALYVHEVMYGPIQRFYLNYSLRALQKALSALNVPLMVVQANFATGLAKAVADVAAALRCSSVHWNRVYDREGRERDEMVRSNITSLGIRAQESPGSELLIEPEDALRNAPMRYSEFHTYERFWRDYLKAKPPKRPIELRHGAFDCFPRSDLIALLASAQLDYCHDPNRWLDVAALGLMSDLPRTTEALLRDLHPVGCERANDTLTAFFGSGRFRDFFAPDHRRDALAPRDGLGTSALSPHIRFGEISPRTVYYAALDQCEHGSRFHQSAERFLKNLCLREFSYYIMARFPEAATRPIKPEFEMFPWKTDHQEAKHRAWVCGTTGFPIVDAAMRQMNSEGWIHNRLRFLLASFYTKYMLLPWADGARYMHSILVDGDQACNSLGWQWTVGCNSDSAPFSTLVNPISFFRLARDKGVAASYIRKYVRELANLDDNLVFMPWKATQEELSSAMLTIVRQEDYLYEHRFENLPGPGQKVASIYPVRIVSCPDARRKARMAMEMMGRIFSTQRQVYNVVDDNSFISPDMFRSMDQRMREYVLLPQSTYNVHYPKYGVVSETVSTMDQGQKLLEYHPESEDEEEVNISMIAPTSTTEAGQSATNQSVPRVRPREEPAPAADEDAIVPETKRRKRDPPPAAVRGKSPTGSDVVVVQSAAPGDALSISGLSYSPMLSENRGTKSMSSAAASLERSRNPQASSFRAAKTPDLGLQKPSRQMSVNSLLSPKYSMKVADERNLRSRRTLESFQKMNVPVTAAMPAVPPTDPASGSASLAGPSGSPPAGSPPAYPSKRIRSNAGSGGTRSSEERSLSNRAAFAEPARVAAPAAAVEPNVHEGTASGSTSGACAAAARHEEALPPRRPDPPPPVAHPSSVHRYAARAGSSHGSDPRQYRSQAPGMQILLPHPAHADQAGQFRSAQYFHASIPGGTPTAAHGYAAWQVPYQTEGQRPAGPPGASYFHAPAYAAERPAGAYPGGYAGGAHPGSHPGGHPAHPAHPGGHPGGHPAAHPAHSPGPAGLVGHPHPSHASHPSHPSHSPHAPHGVQPHSATHAPPPGVGYAQGPYTPSPYGMHRAPIAHHHPHMAMGQQFMVLPPHPGTPMSTGAPGVPYPVLGIGAESPRFATAPSADASAPPPQSAGGPQTPSGDPSSFGGGGSTSSAPQDRAQRIAVARRMAAMDYDDPKLDGKHKEQWQAIALHLLDRYEFCDDLNRQTSKAYVRICAIKDQLREANRDGPRVTVNHCKQVFGILRLPVTGEWDRRGHGGVRGPYVYGLRPKQQGMQ